jgi:hypothetical protein
MERKKCTKCNIEKDITEFYKDRKSFRSDCKICCNEVKKKNYSIKNEYYKAKMKAYDQSEQGKEKKRDRYKKRIKSDPIFKIRKTYRGRLQKAITGWCRSKKTEEILGCSWEEFKIHLENQFIDNMSWENHGYYGWHVDHIIPLASAKTLEDIEKLSHYTNLQPLWAKDNMEKSDSVQS